MAIGNDNDASDPSSIPGNVTAKTGLVLNSRDASSSGRKKHEIKLDLGNEFSEQELRECPDVRIQGEIGVDTSDSKSWIFWLISLMLIGLLQRIGLMKKQQNRQTSQSHTESKRSRHKYDKSMRG